MTASAPPDEECGPLEDRWSEHVGILQCPISGQPLRLLSQTELRSVNAQIVSLTRLSRYGEPVGHPLESGALGTPDLSHVYRIEAGIACLLPSLAMVSPTDVTISDDDENMTSVKKFYDDFGWLDTATGQTNDAAAFTATSDTAALYARATTRRIAARLHGGKYLLDAASGFVAPMFVSLSETFSYRVCMDFSILALRRTQTRLGEHALCVLGDLTALPIASGAVDQSMSLHTIYHIPPEHQDKAIDELVRATRPGGEVVVAYSWSNAPLMNAMLDLTMRLGRLRRGTPPPPGPQTDDDERNLYFRPQGRDWLARLRRRYDVRLRVLSATNTQFQKAFFKDTRFGRAAAAIVLVLESVFEPFAARFGQYPLFIIRASGSRSRPDTSSLKA